MARVFAVDYSGTNLRWFRQFYLQYGNLLPDQICHAVRDKLMPAIVHAARGESWVPGKLRPNLSWTH